MYKITSELIPNLKEQYINLWLKMESHSKYCRAWYPLPPPPPRVEVASWLPGAIIIQGDQEKL